ncbi:hypothetical protein [Streptomyces yaizuensis]|uniref:MarR family transcriptional regulator n=1 Tax=Streptomyces yaizuensis TaxID=2989713 RepID=A0ABQ5P6L2_9ACTN|nr:hypothetical protein [Streptomyces sp. YSPA8]GLF98204.1 hypothetical protein SYYSPA8_27925 [Streptomyces sp. YSPA8]
MTSAPSLGVLQSRALALLASRNSGTWYRGCGWQIGSASRTGQVLGSLVRRGLVTRPDARGRYRITEAGLAELGWFTCCDCTRLTRLPFRGDFRRTDRRVRCAECFQRTSHGLCEHCSGHCQRFRPGLRVNVRHLAVSAICREIMAHVFTAVPTPAFPSRAGNLRDTGGEHIGLPRPSEKGLRMPGDPDGSSDPPCPDCEEPLDCTGTRLFCGNEQCAGWGMEMPVWRVLAAAGLDAPPPSGLPRPVRDGLPVPWVVSSTSKRVWWRAMDARRLAEVHNGWLCQVCGQALPEEAWVLAAPDGMVLQAALHETCKDLALGFCPYLSGGAAGAVPLLVTRDELSTDGLPLSHAAPSAPYFLHQWKLTDAAQGSHRPARPDQPHQG